MIFRFLLLLFELVFGGVTLYFSWCLKPHLFKASWYTLADTLNTFSDDDKLDNQFSMDIGSCLIIDGG